MKIAQLSACYETTPPRNYGSINRIVSDLTECLTCKGHEFTLFATGDSQTQASLISILEQPSPDFYNIDDDWVHVIKSLTTKSKFDVIHNHNIYGGVALDFIADSKA